MINLLNRILADFQAVWANPQANPQETVVFLAAGVVIFLILVVVVLTVVVGGPSDEERKRRRRLRNRFARRYLVPGFLLIVVGLLLAGDEVATAPETCRRCHETEPSVVTWKRASHSSADCLACHGERGISGFVATRVNGLSNLASHYLREPGEMTAALPNGQCLNCHGEVEQGTQTFGGIRVRHEDFLREGASCLQCHLTAGHGGELVASTGRPTMDKCLVCHDGSTAPAECSLCHETDVATAREVPESYPKIHLGENRTCEGCHSLEPCKECHGLQMPHPANFAEPEQHAPPAAFDGKKELCYRCHAETFCRKCHQPFTSHGSDWKTEHALLPRSPELNCKSCHSQTQARIFCDLCHPQDE